MGDEKLNFSPCTGEFQGGFLLPPALGVARSLQALRVTNTQPKDFVIALEIPGGSTHLRNRGEKFKKSKIQKINLLECPEAGEESKIPLKTQINLNTVLGVPMKEEIGGFDFLGGYFLPGFGI